MKKRFLIWDNPKDAIISLTLLLMLVGCINVFSASFVEARDMFEDGYYYLKRYLIFGGAGLTLTQHFTKQSCPQKDHGNLRQL